MANASSAKLDGRSSPDTAMRLVNSPDRPTSAIPSNDRIAAPADGVHAIQMELACRGYMHEPDTVDPSTWPSPWQPEDAAPLRAVLQQVLQACLAFARSPAASGRVAN